MVIHIGNIEPEIKAILDTVHDPEVPVLTVIDMGIMRKMERDDDHVIIHISPTYSGCPAMDTISDDLKAAFSKHDMVAEVKLVLSPAWTTDDMTEEGKRKLEKYGIAPPVGETADKAALTGESNQISCPRCKSKNTKMISAFGSTACKALFQCNDCLEPFDYFKCLK
ncbi:MAG: phenylacetate-CoA oxygenase subunit PaaJ [Flavobacteriales bacterium]|nr:phenylacetate-CoA oxygenase subunit PaaJ [Flavobacteriales bacterium]